MIPKFAVIGAGSWGTALAAQAVVSSPQLQANVEDSSAEIQGKASVALVCRRQQAADAITKAGENKEYLPNYPLPSGVVVVGPEADLSAAKTVLFAVPSHAFRAEVSRWVGKVSETTILVSCTKGIEAETGFTMSEILAEMFPLNPLAVLSGPNHAEEIVKQQPSATVIGCKQEEIAKQLQHRISSACFRAYRSTDVRGIELGGALKNIYAIASGISAGLQLGDNARAALLTRALAEMQRFGVALGGEKSTFYGLSGVGDLVTTAFSEHSRNFRTGRELGQGKTLQQAIDSLHGMVAEGVTNTYSAYTLAKRINMNVPIIEEVHAVLEGQKSCNQAITDLLLRDLKAE